MVTSTNVIAALSTLAKINEALIFLAKEGIIKQEAVSKGCKKFVKDHPEINQALNRLENSTDCYM